MKPILLIPARLTATRLPAKPLADIAGVPMIVRVMRQAVAAELGPVVVAAGEKEILAVVEAAGGEAVLTDPALPSGSDRIHAALQAFDPEGRHDVVVNLQGDLPALDPAQFVWWWRRLRKARPISPPWRPRSLTPPNATIPMW